MDSILQEIEGALGAGLWYAAITLSLTLPDICAWLEMPPGASSGKQKARYIGWCTKHLKPRFNMDPIVYWELRSGLVHQGQYKRADFDRVIFTIPGGAGIHGVPFIIQTVPEQKIYSLDTVQFCVMMLSAARQWYEEHKNDKNVQRNIRKLVKPIANPLEPWLTGPFVIGPED